MIYHVITVGVREGNGGSMVLQQGGRRERRKTAVSEEDTDICQNKI
jgi:hypothetical protein